MAPILTPLFFGAGAGAPAPSAAAAASLPAGTAPPACAPTGVPHFPQKADPSAISLPHLGQNMITYLSLLGFLFFCDHSKVPSFSREKNLLPQKIRLKESS